MSFEDAKTINKMDERSRQRCIIKNFKNKMTCNEIAAKYRQDVDYVYDVAYKHIRELVPNFSKAFEEEIVRMFKNFETPTRISHKTNVPARYINVILRYALPDGEKKAIEVARIKWLDTEILRLLKEGYTVAQIASRCTCGPEKVYWVKREYLGYKKKSEDFVLSSETISKITTLWNTRQVNPIWNSKDEIARDCHCTLEQVEKVISEAEEGKGNGKYEHRHDNT